MPTGYTADIPKGISFEQYALGCARTFGALIVMRDDPKDAPIPDEIKPSDYHAKSLASAETRLAEIRAMTIEDCRAAARKQYDDEEAYRVQRLSENAAMVESYAAMLEKAKAWVPPTPDHEGIKKFMIEQIEQSADFDDMGDHYSKPIECLSANEWRQKQTLKAQKDIAYHAEKHAEEVERTNQRNAWIKALRDSLKTTEEA